VFVRRRLLLEAEGWDDECLAEDCELGVRLSAAGAKVSVCYDPAIATREETPGTLGGWLKQRTRWNQGFLQVYRRGAWKAMPWKRRLFARYTLAMPFLQAFTGLFIPISIYLMLTADVPVPIALISLLPLVPTLLTLVAETAAVGDFAQSYGLRARVRDYVRLVLGALPYQLLLAVAAVRAVARHTAGRSNWEKTVHNNEHRASGADDRVLAGVRL
jgi:cellulose synthase/poly-beta-1,6-N-acetylglucosamine synthase-like glycosyltransferase